MLNWNSWNTSDVAHGRVWNGEREGGGLGRRERAVTKKMNRFMYVSPVLSATQLTVSFSSVKFQASLFGGIHSFRDATKSSTD